jgi:hypothetical protein
MRNRPGRIFYMLNFKGLDQEFVIEYCMDNLRNKQHIEGVCRVASMFDQFNFDMLKALVEEMNRYNESAGQSMRMLNAKPEFGGESKYNVSLQVKGLDVDQDKVEQDVWQGNPLSQTIRIDYKIYNNDVPVVPGEDIDWDWEDAVFSQEDLKQVDPTGGKFVFINDDGDRITLNRVKEKYYDYMDAF